MEYVKACNMPFLLSVVMLAHTQMHADAAPFKKKGFFHYTHMAVLVPNHICGTHAFHALQKSFSTIANQAFATSSNMAVPRDTGIDLAGSNSSGDKQAVQHIPQSTPQHPPISTSLHPPIKTQIFCIWWGWFYVSQILLFHKLTEKVSAQYRCLSTLLSWC